MSYNSTIVLIDNDPLVIFTTKHMVQSCFPSKEILTYQNPKEFISDVNTESIGIPSLIICDYNMPEMTGLQVHDTLKGILSNTTRRPSFYLVSSEENLEVFDAEFKSDFFSGSHQKPLNFDKIEDIVTTSFIEIAS